MKHKVLIVTVLLVVAGLILSNDAAAQCAMCKAASEANLKQGGGDPKGLNNGILYMLLMPYILVGSIGYWWWRNRRKEREQVIEFSEEDFARYN
jgi:hypothetical protein